MVGSTTIGTLVNSPRPSRAAPTIARFRGLSETVVAGQFDVFLSGSERR
jgi:hypothetical protein